MYHTFLLSVAAFIALLTHPIAGGFLPTHAKNKLKNSFALQILCILAIAYWMLKDLGVALIIAVIFICLRAIIQLKQIL